MLAQPGRTPRVTADATAFQDDVDAVHWAAHSDRNTSAVGVRAAMRPGMTATRLAKTIAPMAMRITDSSGTVGSGTT